MYEHDESEDQRRPNQNEKLIELDKSEDIFAVPPMKKFFGLSSDKSAGSSSKEKTKNGASNATSSNGGSSSSARASGPTDGFGGSSSKQLSPSSGHSTKFQIGDKMLDADQIGKLLVEKDKIINRQEKELNNHLNRIADLESKVKSLQVRYDGISFFILCSFFLHLNVFVMFEN